MKNLRAILWKRMGFRIKIHCIQCIVNSYIFNLQKLKITFT